MYILLLVFTINICKTVFFTNFIALELPYTCSRNLPLMMYMCYCSTSATIATMLSWYS